TGPARGDTTSSHGTPSLARSRAARRTGRGPRVSARCDTWVLPCSSPWRNWAFVGSRSQTPVWERRFAKLRFAKQSFAEARSQTGVWEREQPRERERNLLLVLLALFHDPLLGASQAAREIRYFCRRRRCRSSRNGR